MAEELCFQKKDKSKKKQTMNNYKDQQMDSRNKECKFCHTLFHQLPANRRQISKTEMHCSKNNFFERTLKPSFSICQWLPNAFPNAGANTSSFVMALGVTGLQSGWQSCVCICGEQLVCSRPNGSNNKRADADWNHAATRHGCRASAIRPR